MRVRLLVLPVVLVLCLLLGSFESAQAAPLVCTGASGWVIDVNGNPLRGALVTASSGCQGSTTTTDASGHYSVQIEPTVTGTPATVSKVGFATQQHAIVALVGGGNVNDFVLPFDLTISASTAALQPGQQLHISARTTARSSGFVCAWGRWDKRGNLAAQTQKTPVAVLGLNDMVSLSGVASLAGGDAHSLALLTGGEVLAWGENTAGQVGDGTTTERYTPVVVKGVGGSGALSGVTAIAAGRHSLALRANGTVVAWGDNAYGELGDGTITDRTTPVVVQGVGGSGDLDGATAIDGGSFHSLALRSDGTVLAWGYNGTGELGDGTTTSRTTPGLVAGVGGVGTLTDVVAIGAGARHSLALRSDGTVVQWGLEGYPGTLDGYSGTTTVRTVPTLVEGVGGGGILSGVSAIAADGYHNLALREDGSVVGWGFNYDGELGDGTTADRASPVVVHGIGQAETLGDVIALADDGSYHSAVLRADGTIAAWGYNAWSQVGDGTTINRSTPVAVVGVGGVGTLSGATAIAGGGNLSFAARSSSCAPNDPTTRMIAQLPSGQALSLTEGMTDGSGYTAWSGAYTVPTGTVDGTYAVKVCAVVETFAGNCDAAVQAGAPSLVTPVKSLSYRVDGTSPSHVSTVPGPFATTLDLAHVAVTWSDNLVGVDPASLTLAIDGTSRPVTAVPYGTMGYTAQVSATGLASGVHRVTGVAADRVGNLATVELIFTVASLSADAANATLNEQQVVVPPQTGLGPASVTFVNPTATVPSFGEVLSGSSDVGIGSVDRAYALGEVNVEFVTDTPAGPITATKVVAVPLSTATHQIAVVAPSGTGLRAQVPSAPSVLANITVAVPADHRAANATGRMTVRLVSKSAPLLGSMAPNGADVLSAELPDRTAVVARTSVCLEELDPGGGSQVGLCDVDSFPAADLFVPGSASDPDGENVAVAVPYLQGPTDLRNERNDPACSGCIGNGADSFRQVRAGALRFGCTFADLPQGLGLVNLCTGDVTTPPADGWGSLFQNAWSFQDGADHDPVLLQQNHLEVGSDRCPGGARGTATGAAYRVVNGQRSLGSAVARLSAGAFRRRDGVDAAGSLTGVAIGSTTRASTASDETYGWRPHASPGAVYTISQAAGLPLDLLPRPTGSYHLADGVAVNGWGAQVAGGSDASNWWEIGPEAIDGTSGASPAVQRRIQLISATEFDTPDWVTGYAMVGSFEAQLVLDFTGCG